MVNRTALADNTGNRDTAGCEGCPYLLPWGPMIFGTNYDGTKGYHMEIHGYECRMSPTINYASEYRGQARDKCTLRIASLDLDLLDEIQSWIYDNAADTLRADFSRGSMRGTDFSDQGRYSLSISCAQNKKGMAAKAALIQRFFDSGHHRLDKTPEEEKAIVLAAIEEGKAAHQRKKENMRYTISENLENDCVYAYAAKEFWVYDKQACRWYTSGFCREQYERAKQKLSRLTPEDFLADSSDYSLLDDYEIPIAALNALQEAVKSGKREVAPFEGTNPPTPADADASPCAPGASDVHPEPADSEGSPRPNPGDVYRSAKGGRLYKIGEHSDGKKTYYRTMRYDTHSCTWEPANGSLYPELSNVQGEFEAWIRTEQLEPVAPNGDAAASTDENAAQELQPEETPITPTSASSSSAPASLADAGAATQSLSAADPASLAAEPAPAFDYSGMDIATVDTLHWAEREIGEARRDYVARLAQAVYIVHDELVQNVHKQNNQHSEFTFVSWCASVGLGFDRMYLAVLVLNRGFYDFVIERDEEEIETLAAAEEVFWDHLAAEDPPPLDGSEATQNALKAMYPKEDSTLELSLPAESERRLTQYIHLQETIRELQSECDLIKSQIMGAMGDAALGVAGKMLCSWVTRKRTSVDTAALKREYPEIHKKLSKTTAYRVFSVKERKE